MWVHVYINLHLGFLLCHKEENKGSKKKAVAKHYQTANAKSNIVPSSSVCLWMHMYIHMICAVCVCEYMSVSV